MKVRMYTLEKKFPDAHPNSRNWRLASYEDDLREMDCASAEEVAGKLVREVTKTRPYIGYTTDADPEYFYTIPSLKTTDSQRRHALRLWYDGQVSEWKAFRFEKPRRANTNEVL